jgi:hypothetical protein
MKFDHFLLTRPTVPVSSPLRAYHGSQELKDFYVARVRWHRQMDQLVQRVTAEGEYGESDFRGCLVGCTLGTYDHSLYPSLLGMPEGLARYLDTLFEGLSKEDAMELPAQVYEAIPVGADLDPIWWQFNLRIILRAFGEDRTIDAATREGCAPALEIVRRSAAGDAPTEEERSAAWSAAWSAAESAAWSAAWSAAESAAWSADESAAWSAAWSAAESAAWSAAESAAESAEFRAQRDDLLELLRSATPTSEEAPHAA